MSFEIPQILTRSIFFLLVVTIIATYARPNHFEENETAGKEGHPSNPFGHMLQLVQEPDNNNIGEMPFKPWPFDFPQIPAELQKNPDIYYYFRRPLRSNKRQSRYPLCYFNPVSCYKK